MNREAGPRSQSPTALGALGWVFVALGLAIPAGMAAYAWSRNGAPGFPLDDSWIHLTFARNLVERGQYAFSSGTPAVSGSTSPIFVFLEAAGLAFGANEKLLAQLLGIVFQLLFVLTFLALARRVLEDAWLAVLAAGWVALDARLGILAASGMETSLFLWLVCLVFLAWEDRNAVAVGALAGLLVWVRPEGFLVALVLAIDWVAAPGKRGKAGWGLAIFAALAGGYFAFNAALSGTLLPTTFAAKKAFYGAYSRVTFVRRDVLRVALGGGMSLLAPFFLMEAGIEAAALLHREGREPDRGPRAELGWALALPAAYVVLLPFGHRFERYLAPAVPFFCLVGARGLSRMGRFFERAPSPRGRGTAPWFAPAIGGAVLLGQATLCPSGFLDYARACRYTADRQEAAGRWLSSNSPPEAVVATHDVGAISFYSRRRVVDIAGLVTPEVIPHLREGEAEYLAYLSSLFTREGVTHLAFLRNWLEVGNQRPLVSFNVDPEFMAVFEWLPDKTHLVRRRATALDDRAEKRMETGDWKAASECLTQSIELDPDHSRTWRLLGRAREREGQPARAAEAYERALELLPGDEAARDGLERVASAASRAGERGWDGARKPL